MQPADALMEGDGVSLPESHKVTAQELVAFFDACGGTVAREVRMETWTDRDGKTRTTPWAGKRKRYVLRYRSPRDGRDVEDWMLSSMDCCGLFCYGEGEIAWMISEETLRRYPEWSRELLASFTLKNTLKAIREAMRELKSRPA